MFYLHTIQCNIKRNRIKSIITIGLCIFVLLLLNIYLKNMESNKKQLTSLASVSSIYCRITNLDGSLEDGLEISEKLVNNLMSDKQVKDAAFSIRLMAGNGDFPIEAWKENLTLFVAGANKLTAIAGLSAENIHMQKESAKDFFSSSERVCLVSKTVLKKYQWKTGDIIKLKLYYQYYDDKDMLHYAPLELIPVKILGTVDTINSSTDQIPPDILLPLATLRESFNRKHVPFKVESAFFYVKDPLKLNAFKEKMRAYHLMEKIPEAKYNHNGNALAVRDTTFRSLASQLRRNIDTLQGFFPLIGITIVCIGYIASFLLINKRQKEFALMRVLGAGRGICIGILLLEQLTLILTGEIIGGIAAFLLFQSGIAAVTAALIFLVSYLVGCMVALLKMGSTSITETLLSAE